MDDSQAENNELRTVQPPPTSKAKKISAVLIQLACAIYAIWPIDLIPNVIPVLGWVDDIMINVAGLLNTYQAFSSNQTSGLVKFAKYIKWLIIIVIGGMAAIILLLGGLLALACTYVVK